MSTTKWVLDPTHSEVSFKVKHMMISNVTGHINKFNVEVETDNEDFSKAKIHFTGDVRSIDTNNDQRDVHLKSGDFFDVEKYPQVTFDATNYEKTGNGDYTLNGNLTIRDVTKPITLKVEFGGVVTDPYGNIKAGFTVEGKVNRKDFGLTWNAVTEAGGVVVGDELKVHAEIQLVKQS
jgi:polyisoprenoid-binding protein YceI